MNNIYTESFSVEIVRDSETNIKLVETWKDAEGRLHRTGDLPAVTYFDASSGEPERLEYWFRGLEHREHGPSLIVNFLQTGVAICESWKHHGLYREDCVSAIDRDPKSGKIISAFRFKDGQPIPQEASSMDDGLGGSQQDWHP